MAAYPNHRTLTQTMARVPLAEAWLLERVRATRTGTETLSLGEEDFLDSLADHPLFKKVGVA